MNRCRLHPFKVWPGAMPGVVGQVHPRLSAPGVLGMGGWGVRGGMGGERRECKWIKMGVHQLWIEYIDCDQCPAAFRVLLWQQRDNDFGKA